MTRSPLKNVSNISLSLDPSSHYDVKDMRRAIVFAWQVQAHSIVTAHCQLVSFKGSINILSSTANKSRLVTIWCPALSKVDVENLF